MSQLDHGSLADKKSQRHYNTNCIVSDKTSLVSDMIKDGETNDGDMSHEDSMEFIILDNKVNRGTMTEDDDSKLQECRCCLRRMAVLKKIEKIKSIKGSFYLRSRIKYGCSKQAKRNRECQTSASLYEKAEMTYRELKSLTSILDSRKKKKSLRKETFCKCVVNGWERDCQCGEEDKYFEWVWDNVLHGQATSLKECNSLAVFHEDYSCGTSAVRGMKAMDKDQHFWEIKMTSPVYGTDMMVGVGTGNVDLNKYHNTFCSMLGCDLDSWGISYDGRIQHAGKKRKYCCRFGQGTIIGIHLDMWLGTLTFFKNRQSLGVAFGGLKGRTLYPMAISTAARSGMRVISSRSFPSSLQFLCCQRLRQCVPSHLSVLDTVPMPPGLRSFLANNIAWLLHVPHTNVPKPSFDHICHICMPLKSALEHHTDDEGSSDEEGIDGAISCRDSDNNTDEEDLDDFSERASSHANSLANYLIETSLRSKSSRDISAPLSSDLPASSVTSSSPLSDNDTRRSTIRGTKSLGGKKARMDGNSFYDDDGNSGNEVEDDESSVDKSLADIKNLLEDSFGTSLPHQLGKRKRT